MNHRKTPEYLKKDRSLWSLEVDELRRGETFQARINTLRTERDSIQQELETLEEKKLKREKYYLILHFAVLLCFIASFFVVKLKKIHQKSVKIKRKNLIFLLRKKLKKSYSEGMFIGLSEQKKDLWKKLNEELEKLEKNLEKSVKN